MREALGERCWRQFVAYAGQYKPAFVAAFKNSSASLALLCDRIVVMEAPSTDARPLLWTASGVSALPLSYPDAASQVGDLKAGEKVTTAQLRVMSTFLQGRAREAMLASGMWEEMGEPTGLESSDNRLECGSKKSNQACVT